MKFSRLILATLSVFVIGSSAHAERIGNSTGMAPMAAPKGGGAAPGGWQDPQQLPESPITPFIKQNFDKCTQKAAMGSQCKFKNLGIMGDKAHQSRRSCHNAREAIDIGDIQCGGQTYNAKQDQFCQFVKCFADDTNGQTTDIFAKKCGSNKIKGDHDKHVHIEKKPCRMITGGGGGGNVARADSFSSKMSSLIAGLFGIQEADAAPETTKEFEKNFDKKMVAPAVGKVRIKYEYHGEPMLSPAEFTLFAKCEGSKKELEIVNEDICSINKWEYNASDKSFIIDVQKGVLDETSSVHCTDHQELKYNVGDFCKEAARKAAGLNDKK